MFHFRIWGFFLEQIEVAQIEGTYYSLSRWFNLLGNQEFCGVDFASVFPICGYWVFYEHSSQNLMNYA